MSPEHPKRKSVTDAGSLSAPVRGTRAGVLVFLGVAGLNLGNAIFHLVTARVLGPARYSEVVSLLAVQGLLALPFGGVQYTTARFVAEEATRGDSAALASFVRRFIVATGIAGVVISAILCAVSPLVRPALGVGALTPVVLTALFMFPALLVPLASGVAQGLQRFGLISASLITGTASRLVLVLMLIPFGLGVGGVMGATLVSGFAALIPLAALIRRWTRGPSIPDCGPSTRDVLRYAAPVVGGTLAITSLTTADLIVAKIALSASSAGVYAAGSFVGRLLLYLPMTIATVLLPKVTSRAALSEETREILYASLAVTAAFSLFGTAVLVAVPKLLIHVTFGSKYEGAIPLIGLFGLVMTAYALLNVQLAYHLGHGREGMAWLLLGGAVAQIAVYGVVHGSTYQLVSANLAVATLLLLVHEVAFESTLPGAVRWGWTQVRVIMRGYPAAR